MERAQSSVCNGRSGAVELRAGAASVIGRVHEELGDGNEDGYLIDRQHFVFALYDTHGPQAPAVLKLIGDTIPPAFAEFLNRPPAEKEAALRGVAARIDEQLVAQALSNGSGSTLSAVHFCSPNAFWLLHIGDSMVIKARQRSDQLDQVAKTEGTIAPSSSAGKRKHPEASHRPVLDAVQLTPLHRLSTAAELARVRAAGAALDDKYIVHPSDPDKVIALTRTLGDTDMREPQCGVIAVPDPVQLCPLDPDDKFIAVVSDGVHERITPQEIVDRINQCTARHSSAKQVAVQFLQDLERDALLDDDATIIVVLIDR